MTTATAPRTFASFTRLRDNTWGVRLPYARPPRYAGVTGYTGPVGDTVLVQKANGTVETVVPTKFVFGGADYSVYRFVRPGDNTAPLAPPAPTPEDGYTEPERPLRAAYTAQQMTEAVAAVPVIPTDRLFWAAPTCTFACDISNLHDLLRAAPDRVVLRSHVTGNDVTFALNRAEKDRDGDTVAWEYLSVGTTGLKLTLFND